MIVENSQLFESYLLGGLEYLHERLCGDSTYDRDMMVNELYDFIKEFHEDLQMDEHELQDILESV